MDFELSRRRTIEQNVQRLVGGMLAEAADLLDAPADVTTAVHEARKRTKMVRALMRLVEPGLGRETRRIVRPVRDAARELSDLRDAHALAATWRRAAAVRPALAELDAVTRLVERRAGAAVAGHDDPRLVSAVEHLERAAALVGRIELADGSGAIRAGLRISQRQARAALRSVHADATDAHLHELRKRMKDLWYHGRLLRPAAPALLDGHVTALHALSDALGDDHDLAVLVTVIASDADDADGLIQLATIERLVAIVGPLRHELQRRSLLSAGRILAEPPKAVARRLGSYLSLWYDHGDELRVGGIDEVLTE